MMNDLGYKKGIRWKKVQLSSDEAIEDDVLSEGHEGFKYSRGEKRLRPRAPAVGEGLVQSDVWLHAQRHKTAVIRQWR
jgi:hypothetical protein